MSIIGGILLAFLVLPMWVTSKQVRFPDHMQEFPISSSEYRPVYGGSPDQDLSAESIGIEFEDSIIRSMLRIVDGKFNTLSTRLNSLERGINGLQVYLSRQFRHVTKNLQAVNIVMNGLHAEVSHVDMETRSVRNSILALNKEFLDYRNRNLGVFRELPLVPSGPRKVPVDDSQEKKNLNQSRHTDRREIDVEYKTSAKPILLASLGSPEEMADGAGNDTIYLNDMHTHIEKGFTKLNETVGKRFDDLRSATENIDESLDRVQGGVTEINATLMDSITNQNVIQDGVTYLKGMVEYLTERQDQILMDVSLLRDQAHGRPTVVTGPAAADQTTTGDSQHQKKTAGSIDLKREFETISDKLDMIDNRVGELDDNLVHTSDILEASRNNTEHVVKLVEALSGSTIWIPHILQEVKMTARSLNESINATYLVYKQMLGRRSDTPPGDQLPGAADGEKNKLKKKESESYHQNGSPPPNFQCKIHDEDTKLIRNQISKVEEILEKLKNTTTTSKNSKTEPDQEKSAAPNSILLRKKEVRGNSTSGILSIQSDNGWLHVCYDETQSNLVSSIACTQLGFSLGTPLIVPNLLQSTEKAFLINCLQREPNLDYCSYKMVSTDYCKDVGLLGVFCVD